MYVFYVIYEIYIKYVCSLRACLIPPGLHRHQWPPRSHTFGSAQNVCVYFEKRRRPVKRNTKTGLSESDAGHTQNMSVRNSES